MNTVHGGNITLCTFVRDFGKAQLICVWTLIISVSLEQVLSQAYFGCGWATGSPAGPLPPLQIKFGTTRNLENFSPLHFYIISIKSPSLFDVDVFQLSIECYINSAPRPHFHHIAPPANIHTIHIVIASESGWRERP